MCKKYFMKPECSVIKEKMFASYLLLVYLLLSKKEKTLNFELFVHMQSKFEIIWTRIGQVVKL